MIRRQFVHSGKRVPKPPPQWRCGTNNGRLQLNAGAPQQQAVCQAMG
jgi:hypothetical protein